jgi:hypothetical protein
VDLLTRETLDAFKLLKVDGGTLSLDPGGTTGMAYEFPGRRSIITGEALSEKDMWDVLTNLCPVKIIYEGFYWQPIDSVDFAPLYIIGVIKLYAQLRQPFVKLIKQMPSDKQFWTDDKLKRAGMWVVGSPHERDAIRHLLHHTTFAMNDKRWLMKLKDT